MARIVAVCVSGRKGTAKGETARARFVAGHGIEGDAHAGDWHRQVSLLSYRKIEAFRARGAEVAYGAFGENVVVDDVDFAALEPGVRFRCGTARLELTQVGKECHKHCAIFERMGDCIMPREGAFARVLEGGTAGAGDDFHVE